MTQLNEIGALWKRKSKTTGEEYLSGTIQINGKAIEIRAFTNKYKKADNQPDFRIMVEVAEDQPAPPPAEPIINHDRNESVLPEYPEEQIDPSDIPF